MQRIEDIFVVFTIVTAFLVHTYIYLDITERHVFSD